MSKRGMCCIARGAPRRPYSHRLPTVCSRNFAVLLKKDIRFPFCLLPTGSIPVYIALLKAVPSGKAALHLVWKEAPRREHRGSNASIAYKKNEGLCHKTVSLHNTTKKSRFFSSISIERKVLTKLLIFCAIYFILIQCKLELFLKIYLV